MRVLLDDVGSALEREKVVAVLGESAVLVVHVAEGEVEDDSKDAANSRWSTKGLCEKGITNGRRAGEADGVGDGDGGIEHVNARYETLMFLGALK